MKRILFLMSIFMLVSFASTPSCQVTTFPDGSKGAKIDGQLFEVWTDMSVYEKYLCGENPKNEQEKLVVEEGKRIAALKTESKEVKSVAEVKVEKKENYYYIVPFIALFLFVLLLKVLDILTKYDKNGFDGYGKHKETKTEYDKDGFNKNGFDKNGFRKDGFNSIGFDKNGIHKDTQTKYDKNGFDESGFDENGFNEKGFAADGIHVLTKTKYNEDGFDKNGIHKDTQTKYDKDGFDKSGYDKDYNTRDEVKKLRTVSAGSFKNSSNKSYKKTIPTIKPGSIFDGFKKKPIENRAVDAILYEYVLTELEQGVKVKGLWAKAYAHSDGDENKIEPKYMQYRVQDIKDALVSLEIAYNDMSKQMLISYIKDKLTA